MSITESVGVTEVYLAKLILEELRLIRSEMKEEIQKLSCYMKICLMHQDNIEQSENTRRNCEYVVEVSDLKKPVNDVVDGALVCGDGFAVDGLEKNGNELMRSEKSPNCTAMKLDGVNSDIRTSYSASAKGCKKNDNDNVNDEVCYFIKEESEPTSFVSYCTTVEPSSSRQSDLSSDWSRVIKCNQYDSDHSVKQNAHKTSTNVRLIGMDDVKVPENNDKNDSIKGRPETGNSFQSNTKRGRIREKANVSTITKVSKKHKQVYTCQVCLKSYERIDNFACHVQSHTDEGPHECVICLKRFKRTSYLKLHYRIHTGERPHKCDICSKGFKRISTLKEHYRTHTGERPYACDRCSKRFKNLSALNKHIRIHTGERPFECDICSKKFCTLSGLVVHYRTHTGERPYKCDFCSKRFKQISALNMHHRIHTGEKPFKCDRCSKEFWHRSLLTKHYRIHTE